MIYEWWVKCFKRHWLNSHHVPGTAGLLGVYTILKKTEKTSSPVELTASTLRISSSPRITDFELKSRVPRDLSLKLKIIPTVMSITMNIDATILMPTKPLVVQFPYETIAFRNRRPYWLVFLTNNNHYITSFSFSPSRNPISHKSRCFMIHEPS